MVTDAPHRELRTSKARHARPPPSGPLCDDVRMEPTSEVLRYAAFTTTPDGGNPAGVVLDATRLDDARMQAIAADVGYAETVFVTEAAVDGDSRRNRVRYFSPIAEVPFCGHATIALAVALSGRDGAGTFIFETPVGPVAIETAGQGAAVTASFTSVEPRVTEFPDGVLSTLLGLLGVDRGELHPAYPPMIAFAGNWHPILVFAERKTFDSFVFDPDSMRTLMDAQNWAGTVTTLYEMGAGRVRRAQPLPGGHHHRRSGDRLGCRFLRRIPPLALARGAAQPRDRAPRQPCRPPERAHRRHSSVRRDYRERWSRRDQLNRTSRRRRHRRERATLPVRVVREPARGLLRAGVLAASRGRRFPGPVPAQGRMVE